MWLKILTNTLAGEIKLAEKCALHETRTMHDLRNACPGFESKIAENNLVTPGQAAETYRLHWNFGVKAQNSFCNWFKTQFVILWHCVMWFLSVQNWELPLAGPENTSVTAGGHQTGHGDGKGPLLTNCQGDNIIPNIVLYMRSGVLSPILSCICDRAYYPQYCPVYAIGRIGL